MIYRERQQAALMPGLLADLMHPHRRHRPVHPHVHAAVFAGHCRVVLSRVPASDVPLGQDSASALAVWKPHH